MTRVTSCSEQVCDSDRVRGGLCSILVCKGQQLPSAQGPTTPQPCPPTPQPMERHGQVPELTILETQEQGGITSLSGEISKTFRVPEELVLHVLEMKGPLQPALLQRGFIQVKECLDDKDIVLQEALDGHSAGRQGRKIRISKLSRLEMFSNPAKPCLLVSATHGDATKQRNGCGHHAGSVREGKAGEDTCQHER